MGGIIRFGFIQMNKLAYLFQVSLLELSQTYLLFEYYSARRLKENIITDLTASIDEALLQTNGVIDGAVAYTFLGLNGSSRRFLLKTNFRCQEKLKYALSIYSGSLCLPIRFTFIADTEFLPSIMKALSPNV